MFSLTQHLNSKAETAFTCGPKLVKAMKHYNYVVVVCEAGNVCLYYFPQRIFLKEDVLDLMTLLSSVISLLQSSLVDTSNFRKSIGNDIRGDFLRSHFFLCSAGGKKRSPHA